MKFREEEIFRTEFYRHVRLHQSIKLKSTGEKDNFDDEAAAMKEV